MSRRFSHFRLPDPLMSSPAPAWARRFGTSQDDQALILKHLQFHPNFASWFGPFLMRWRDGECLTNGHESLDRAGSARPA